MVSVIVTRYVAGVPVLARRLAFGGDPNKGENVAERAAAELVRVMSRSLDPLYPCEVLGVLQVDLYRSGKVLVVRVDEDALHGPAANPADAAGAQVAPVGRTRSHVFRLDARRAAVDRGSDLVYPRARGGQGGRLASDALRPRRDCGAAFAMRAALVHLVHEIEQGRQRAEVRVSAEKEAGVLGVVLRIESGTPSTSLRGGSGGGGRDCARRASGSTLARAGLLGALL